LLGFDEQSTTVDTDSEYCLIASDYIDIFWSGVMAKIVINNRAESIWDTVIEEKLQIIFGSMLAYTNRIDIELDRASEVEFERITYTCTLSLEDATGERYVLCNNQPDGELAIEGVIARARRVMIRRSRTRAGGWRATSSQ
jgi:hypothetical protein